MKELSLNELKQVNGGGEPGQPYTILEIAYHGALPIANAVLLTYDAVSDWWC